MTAPANPKTTASRTRTDEREQSLTTKTHARTAMRTRSPAGERAYTRREERRDRSLREIPQRRPGKQRQTVEETRLRRVVQAKPLHERVAISRVAFVVAGMGVLTTGLFATLWLSIAAVSGSYRLQQGDADIDTLNQRKEQLMREVSSMASTPALQRRATELGMVPGPEPAHLVVRPDGSTMLVGEPQAAAPAAPVPAAVVRR